MPDKPRQVIWSGRAKRDVVAISRFYQERNGNDRYSLNLLDRFTKAAEAIEQNEEIGEKIPGSDHRFLTVEPYKLIYKIGSVNIVITTVWDARRNPEDLNI